MPIGPGLAGSLIYKSRHKGKSNCKKARLTSQDHNSNPRVELNAKIRRTKIEEWWVFL